MFERYTKGYADDMLTGCGGEGEGRDKNDS